MCDIELPDNLNEQIEAFKNHDDIDDNDVLAPHRFFCNSDCRYFPCHKTDSPKTFNCLFCFCPLYPNMDCGGHYTLIKNENGDMAIKDCSGCMLPHDPKGYDYIIRKLHEAVSVEEE